MAAQGGGLLCAPRHVEFLWPVGLGGGIVGGGRRFAC